MRFELVVTDTTGYKKSFDLYKVADQRKRKRIYRELIEDLKKMGVDPCQELIKFCQDELKYIFERRLDFDKGLINKYDKNGIRKN